MENGAMQNATRFEKVNAILDAYNYDSSRMITILQKVQEEYRYLPQEVITYVATCLRVSPARVYGVATFYSHFSLDPKGKYVIKICDGTACHVKGSSKLINALRKELNLSEKQKTTADMLFTLETVSCLGACGLAPVVVVNEDVYGLVSEEKALEIVTEIRTKEEKSE
jgi:NADH-quinone oxidoreductase subunit E